MEIGGNEEVRTWEGYVDWRNRAALRAKHGGFLAASFVLVVEVLENLAYLANASNLVLYLSHQMHFSPSQSANSVTNFMGTAFMLALLGGFFSDAFFTPYHVYVFAALLEFLGLGVLTIQAFSTKLKPPRSCVSGCEPVHGTQAAVLFTGLYLVALGVGGIKGSLPAHGAEQFDQDSPQGRKQRSTFFNYFVFSLASGALIAVTLVVWVEDNKGWQWGFGISTFAIFLSIPVFLSGSMFYRNKIPSGSPLTTISKVLVAAILNTGGSRNLRNAVASMPTSSSPVTHREKGEVFNMAESTNDEQQSVDFPLSESLRFLNRAVLSRGAECSVQEVEEVKVVIKTLPVFACTIMISCCLAQLSTFSVHQASTMNTKLGSMKVPPASLPFFPVVFIMILAPVYDHIIIPCMRKMTKTEMGISHLQRIGIGLFLSIVAMGVAAVVEVKRKNVAAGFDSSSKEPLPITFFWIAFQYLFLGSADLFTLAGLLEFFFSEAPSSMRSLATSLSWTSLAIGYYLSSAIVAIVNSMTGSKGHRPWLSGDNLNHYHLERFYWLMCILSLLNFIHYLFWASRYKYINLP